MRQVLRGDTTLPPFEDVSQARRSALNATGHPIPNPVPIQALIDTGTSGTCVVQAILTFLSLTATGSTLMLTPSIESQTATVETFDVSLRIYATAQHPPLVHHAIPMMRPKLAV